MIDSEDDERHQWKEREKSEIRIVECDQDRVNVIIEKILT